MLPYPTFPSSSALGAFPGFPVYAVHIPNVIDLPSYIASVTAYYGDVFNAPYSNPPKIATWTIWIPNLSGIFSWIINIFLWLGGWIGAVFAYGIKYAAALLANTAIYIFDIGTGLITSILLTMESLTAPAGMWAIPLDVVIVGLLLIGTIMGLFAISKGVLRILEM